MNELWYFYADWCHYCKQQTPVLDEYIERHPEISVIKILESENKDAIEQNNIKGFPTFFVFKKDGSSKVLDGLQTPDLLEAIF